MRGGSGFICHAFVPKMTVIKIIRPVTNFSKEI